MCHNCPQPQIKIYRLIPFICFMNILWINGNNLLQLFKAPYSSRRHHLETTCAKSIVVKTNAKLETWNVFKISLFNLHIEMKKCYSFDSRINTAKITFHSTASSWESVASKFDNIFRLIRLILLFELENNSIRNIFSSNQFANDFSPFNWSQLNYSLVLFDGLSLVCVHFIFNRPSKSITR